MLATPYEIRGESITAGYPASTNCQRHKAFMNNAGKSKCIIPRIAFEKSNRRNEPLETNNQNA